MESRGTEGQGPVSGARVKEVVEGGQRGRKGGGRVDSSNSTYRFNYILGKYRLIQLTSDDQLETAMNYCLSCRDQYMPTDSDLSKSC